MVKKEREKKSSFWGELIRENIKIIIVSIVSFILGILFKPIYEHIYNPMEPRIDARFNSLFLVNNHDTKQWEGILDFKIRNLENNETLVRINSIKIMLPNISPRPYILDFQKDIRLPVATSVQDSLHFKLPIVKEFENYKVDDFLYLVIRVDLYYPTGSIAATVDFDTHEMGMNKIDYNWDKPDPLSYEHLSRMYKNRALPDNWERGELTFRDRTYDYFYTPADSRFKLRRDIDCESIEIVIPRNAKLYTTIFPKDGQTRALEMGRVILIPEPEIGDRFLNLDRFNWDYELIDYKKDGVYSEEHTLTFREGYTHIFFYRPAIKPFG